MARPYVPPITKACEWCGSDYQTFARDKRRFCSKSCAAISNSVFRDLRGPRNNRYNGGLCIHKGRAMVCCRDGSTLWYSRALMAAHIGRLLRSDELVHHINGDGSDDRIENLQIVTRAEHINIHRDDLQAARGI